LVQQCASARWLSSGGGVTHGQRHLTGTPFASFDNNGNEPDASASTRASVFGNQEQRRIWVWGQWGGPPIQRRYIRFKTVSAAPE